MLPLQFRDRMQELAMMVRNDQTTDLFVESYEDLLDEVAQEKDKDLRIEQVIKMKMMLGVQSAYMLNQYKKAVIDSYETRGNA
jgi:hypothetical protein